MRARLADLGQEFFPREQQTPEALAAMQKADIDEMVADHQSLEHQGGVKTGRAALSATVLDDKIR